MLTSSFGGTVKLTGESEYRAALKEISSNLKVLNSEMKAVTSEYDKNDKSVANLSKQNEVLNKKIDEQEKKVSTLKEALAKSKAETGESSETTKKWQTELNNAQAELNKLNKDVITNEQLMRQEEEAVRKGYKSFEEMAEAERKAQKETVTLGDLIKANLTSEAIIAGVKALADGIATVGKAMFELGKDAVESYGELEQNLGGSKAVFGEYASQIQKTGEEAYKNLGISQSEYLATANKMGALFQGSGMEQQKSLEMTEKAMQRAADMASVMGIDMESAMEAVTGAAKGNFTMMDNLGVAMNATAVEAYAASKGLDFVWASASQAEKTEMAMQMFFDNTAQYAGNFANEATQTISGSFGLLSASVESLMGGLGNANADIVNLAQNVIDAAMSVVDNVAPIIENIIAAMPVVMDTLVSAISEKLPELLDMGAQLLGSLLNGISQSLGTIMPVVMDVIQTLLTTIVQNLPLILGMGIQMLTSLIQGIADTLPELIPLCIESVILMVETLLDNIDLIIDAGIDLIIGLADGLIRAVPTLLEKIPIIINKVVQALTGNLPKLLAMGIELTVKLGLGLIAAIPQLVTQIPQIILAIVGGLAKGVADVGRVGGDLVRGLWNGISDMASWVISKIKGFGQTILDSLKSFFGIHSPSKVFKDEIGNNLALGVGEGFADTMAEVSDEMQSAIPTEFDASVTTNVSSNGQVNTYDMMVGAFKQALREVKVVLDDREMGSFVTDTIERQVFA